MSIVEEMGDALARDVIAALDDLGDDRFYDKVSKILADSSPTLQESFMTAIRVRLADIRARRFLEKSLEAKRTGAKAPATPGAADSGH